MLTDEEDDDFIFVDALIDEFDEVDDEIIQQDLIYDDFDYNDEADDYLYVQICDELDDEVELDEIEHQ